MMCVIPQTKTAESLNSGSFLEIAASLAEIARGLYVRGWMLGTSGNLSAVVDRNPLRLAISQSGVDKGGLTPAQVLLIDEAGKSVKNAQGKPSDESLLHIEIIKQRSAGAVIHTHSVWNTIISDLNHETRGVIIEGYEMLKGLRGVGTHLHREWLPVIENSQDMVALRGAVAEVLAQNPEAHGFLLVRHGLYTWGEDLREAKRHVEILEFLLETLGRTAELHRASL